MYNWRCLSSIREICCL